MACFSIGIMKKTSHKLPANDAGNAVKFMVKTQAKCILGGSGVGSALSHHHNDLRPSIICGEV